MGMAQWIELYGDRSLLAAGGAAIGLAFGFLAQRSRFCLRAAVIEFWHRRFGDKLTVWLLAFSAAVIGVQLLSQAGWLDTANARQIATRGSLSGALGTLQVFYDLSARLTLRAAAGDRSGVDLIYALSYDRIGGPTQPSQARPLPRR